MITILGPTASGKTSLAVAVARRIDGEIISADSRQVYRRMDIGTGKDLDEYIVSDQYKTTYIPYHLIDICEPGTKYNLFQYQQDFFNAYNNIIGRGKTPVLCGGTGLYIEAVLKGYQLAAVPENKILRAQLEDKSLDELAGMLVELKQRNGNTMHNKTDVDTVKRAIRAIEIETFIKNHPDKNVMSDGGSPSIDSIIIGVNIDREERRRRITLRLRQRLDEGMIDEVRALLDSGIKAYDLIYYGLEYKYVTEYVIGRIGYNEMFNLLEIAIYQFAKRQMTWFRGMERRGLTIHWVDAMLPTEDKVAEIIRLTEGCR